MAATARGPVTPTVETLVDLLDRRAAASPERVIYRFLGDGPGEAGITFGELAREAAAIGRMLRDGTQPGDRVLLLFPPGLKFLSAFFGCHSAGTVAVPAYPPHPSRLEQSLPRLRAILDDAGPAVVLTTEPLRALLEPRLALEANSPAVRFLVADDLPLGLGPSPTPRLTADALALLQYTSGSTGQPKGVMVTHGNLLHNLAIIQDAFGADATSVGVFWLPFYHDMGLIGGALETLYCGGTSTFLSPSAFVQRPLRWLQTIAETRATISGGPNFAYDECLRRTTPEQRAALDLSSWTLAFCGAEPIHAATLQRFAEAFAPSGFRQASFYPCYGLAEATLMVTGGDKAAPPVVISDACDLEIALPPPGEPRAKPSRVGCGHPRGGQRLVIVDPETGIACAEGEIGEIWISGPCVAQGYWNRPADTAETFQARLTNGDGPFLRTGDLGFLLQRELFVTGRVKDLIIIGGRNHYPQDIERTVEQSHPALLQNATAAFAIEVEQEERLVVVTELDWHFTRKLTTGGENGRDPLVPIVTAIRRGISEQHEITAHRVVLLRALTIPRTTSGKVQRHACRAGFLAQSLQTVQ